MTPEADARMQRARELLAHIAGGGPHEWGYRCLATGEFIADDWPFRAAETLAALSEQTDAREAALREAADYAGRRNRGFIAAGGRSDQAFGRALEAEHMRDAILALIGKAPGA